MRRDPASLPVWAAGPVLAAVHRPCGRTVAAAVAPGVLVEGMAMMDADVHAWARERLAQALAGDGVRVSLTTLARADAVLAVLPELLTDHEVVVTVHEQTTHTIRHVTVILTAAAEALAGVS